MPEAFKSRVESEAAEAKSNREQPRVPDSQETDPFPPRSLVIILRQTARSKVGTSATADTRLRLTRVCRLCLPNARVEA